MPVTCELFLSTTVPENVPSVLPFPFSFGKEQPLCITGQPSSLELSNTVGDIHLHCCLYS